jgi:hypothetical protein
VSYVWQKWLADALRDEGCDVREYEGWKSRGRPASSGSFDPYGVLVHHTGTKTSASNPCPTLSTCVNGRSDLPGPLCQVLIGYDGVCHVIAAGRANHGGECNGNGPTSSGDANAQLLGIEVDYSGSQAVSDKQADATVRASAAILRHYGKDASYCRGHKETSTTGKWDPGRHGSGDPAYRMDEVRGYVADRLSGDEDDMPSDAHLKDLMRQAVQAELGDENAGVLSDRIADKVWAEPITYAPDDVTQKAGPGWLVYTERRVEDLQAAVADLTATVDAIATALGVARTP